MNENSQQPDPKRILNGFLGCIVMSTFAGIAISLLLSLLVFMLD